MAKDTDFAALYRELGIDATCSLAELRSAWRRRVAKLHPDQGGNAEDTGRLQELNRLRDAAVNFHALHGRMPGAAVTGSLSSARSSASQTQPAENALFTADSDADELTTSGFGRISRYFTAVSLIAIAVLGWRVIQNDDGHDNASAVFQANHADARNSVSERESTRAAVGATSVKRTITRGMSKDTVRNILGEPLDMHALRWTYGPSWVEFHCDKVVDWYSSPLRPLRGASAREAQADAAHRDDDHCR